MSRLADKGGDVSAKRPIYMDNHATTRVDPRVIEAMLPYFENEYGNAASRTHAYGWRAEEAVDTGRARVATLIGANPKEIVFTSGATESNNLAIKGVLDFYAERGRHVVTVRTEHKAVLDPCRFLEKRGLAEVTILKTDAHGLVDPGDVRRAIRDDTVLVSVMHANSEIGVIQPLAEIGEITREAGVLLHSDAAQSAGKIAVDVDASCVDLMSLSAHKMYGPKGIGALFVRTRDPRVRLIPLMDGGGQERGMRSGTLNVPGIVGFGHAAEIAGEELPAEAKRVGALRDRLSAALFEALDEVYLNGHSELRLPGNLNLSFAFVEGESLLMGLKDVALSSGSACTSASLEPSHVLRAIGLSNELAHSSIRFGLGRFNTEAEVDHVAGRVVEEVRRLRTLSPLYDSAKSVAGGPDAS
jgi:cysteine desulfurase